MIRLKCPKCSFALALEDSKAGQVGLCTECGAKFRIPARKSAAAARPTKESEAKRRPPAIADDDDEDEGDEDESDDEGDEPRKAPPARKSDAMSAEAKSTVRLAVFFLVAIVALGIGGMYIHHLALLVTAISVLLAMTCSLMIAREAWSDGASKFMMVWLIPLYLLYFVYENWSRTKELFIPYVGFLLLAVASAFAYLQYEDRILEKRKATKAKLALEPAIVRMYHEA
jgi:uncharacterized Zn finger protein (UPF0148 family)